MQPNALGLDWITAMAKGSVGPEEIILLLGKVLYRTQSHHGFTGSAEYVTGAYTKKKSPMQL